MKRFHCTALLLSCVLAACGQQAPTPKVDAIATVNGKPLPRSEFEMYVVNIERQGNNEQKMDAELRGKLLDQYIGLHLAAEAGAKRGLDKEQKIADELAFARTKVLSDAALQRYLDENPVKEEELKPAYEKGVAELPPQYHTSHILVDNPGTASELIAKIKGGADFAKLATAQSLDSSKSKGGDLGWLVPQDMPDEYAAAVAKLQAGELTQEPVKSRFGWHVIRLKEKKPQDVAPFEEVKDKVVLLVKRQRIEGYLQSLRKQAKIDLDQRGPKT